MYRVTFSRRTLGVAFLSGCAFSVGNPGATVKGNNVSLASDAPGAAQAAAPVLRSVGRSPSQGLRPIGGPSPVDVFSRPQGFSRPQDSARPQGFAGPSGSPRSQAPIHPDIANPVAQPVLPASGGSGQVAQTAYMQGEGFAMPPSGSAVSPATPNGGAAPRPAPAVTGGANGGLAPGASPATNGLQAPPLRGGSVGGVQPAAPPPTSAAPLPGGLQPVPSTAPLTAPPQSSPQASPLTATPLIASPSDAAPVPQPRLSSTWATADNCNLVSYPSGYRAEFGACVPGPVVPMTYAAPPAVVVPPTIMPGVAPPVVIPATAGHRPLFTLGQENYNVQLGQGIIGQPKAYVPGQYFRNFIRYFSP